MKLSDQVTSLELSKKLKELGVKQESLFDWWVNHSFPEANKPEKYNEGHWKSISYEVHASWLGNDNKRWGHNDKLCSAFTVAELGEMLPGVIETENAAYANRKHPNKGMRNAYYLLSTGRSDPETKDSWFDCVYQDASQPDDTLLLNYVEAETEADARAKMLIYLLEAKLMTLPKGTQ